MADPTRRQIAMMADEVGITDYPAAVSLVRRAFEVSRSASAALAEPAPPAAGEVKELVARLRRASDGASAMGWEQDSWVIARAADLLAQRHPAPVPVAERLPELRGMFERILCVARSSGQRPVWNIELADRLIGAVVSWAALPLPAGEVE